MKKRKKESMILVFNILLIYRKQSLPTKPVLSGFFFSVYFFEQQDKTMNLIIG